MNTPKRNSILIVDDEEMNLNILTGILRDYYDIRAADSGTAAVKIALDDPPDLILLDVLMPEMDGYKVLSVLKENDKTRKIPVIFITGLDSKEDEEKGLAMDAADYISKPFSVGIVRLRVKNQIQIVNQIRTIEDLSLIDQLTGIPNRRSLDERFAMEWGRAFREKIPLSLMMMDIDKFKNFNDKYGHLTGDEVLKIVAASFEQSLKRKSDFAARFGGEEFSILLPNIDIQGALHIAEEVRKGVEKLIIPCGEGETTSVTISIGVHSFIPKEDDTIPDMIEKADMALYAAKETGRNRVCRYEESMSVKDDAKPAAGKDAPIAAAVQQTEKEKEILPEHFLEAIRKIKEINIEAGMSHFHGMENMYVQTVSYFCKRIIKVCEDMDRFIRGNDIKNFSISVHSAKSMLATVGASELSAVAADLEFAGKNGDFEHCLNAYPGLHKKLLELQEKLSTVFPKDEKEKAKEAGNAGLLREKIKKALDASCDYDCDTALEEVKTALQYDFGKENNTLLEAALEALSEYDYALAVEKLNNIRL